MNIIKSLNQYIRNNSNATYGDLLNNTNKEEIIKRTLNEQELTYYCQIKENTQQRIFEISGNNNNNTNYKIENPINRYVSGIGKVQQIM